ncbi:hypothetical protein ACFPH8_08605 [Bizionia hallyeonensis]|uniref:Uncharacterized protein n=1 Tax=Bizionia hallyeonensis TaxID=1123757 RepID=A0ABW0C5B4_9FLAO
MTLKIGKGNPDGNILIIESIEVAYEKSTYDTYQIFHDRVHYLVTNKSLNFETNFYLVKQIDLKQEKELILKLSRKFNVIVLNCGDNILKNEIEYYFNVNSREQEKWKSDEYSVYDNSDESKIIINVKDFKTLSEDTFNDLAFELTGYIKRPETVYYQFSCIKCEEFNLTILHRSEPMPSSCKYCQVSIFDSEGNINNDMSILDKEKLKKLHNEL